MKIKKHSRKSGVYSAEFLVIAPVCFALMFMILELNSVQAERFQSAVRAQNILRFSGAKEKPEGGLQSRTFASNGNANVEIIPTDKMRAPAEAVSAMMFRYGGGGPASQAFAGAHKVLQSAVLAGSVFDMLEGSLAEDSFLRSAAPLLNVPKSRTKGVVITTAGPRLSPWAKSTSATSLSTESSLFEMPLTMGDVFYFDTDSGYQTPHYSQAAVLGWVNFSGLGARGQKWVGNQSGTKLFQSVGSKIYSSGCMYNYQVTEKCKPVGIYAGTVVAIGSTMAAVNLLSDLTSFGAAAVAREALKVALQQATESIVASLSDEITNNISSKISHEIKSRVDSIKGQLTQQIEGRYDLLGTECLIDKELCK